MLLAEDSVAVDEEVSEFALVSLAVDDTTVVVAEDVRVTRLVGVDVTRAADEESERIEVNSAASDESLDFAIDVATTISELTPEITLVTTAEVATSSTLALEA